MVVEYFFEVVVDGCRLFLLLVTTRHATEIRRHVQFYFRDQCRHDFPPRAVIFFCRFKMRYYGLRNRSKLSSFLRVWVFETQALVGRRYDVNNQLDRVPWSLGFYYWLSSKFEFMKYYCKGTKIFNICLRHLSLRAKNVNLRRVDFFLLVCFTWQ